MQVHTRFRGTKDEIVVRKQFLYSNTIGHSILISRPIGIARARLLCPLYSKSDVHETIIIAFALISHFYLLLSAMLIRILKIQRNIERKDDDNAA